MNITSFMKYSILGLLGVIICNISTTQAIFNGATVLQTLMSGSTLQTGSTTKVLYRGIRKNTSEYILLQQAIDSHIIDNKKTIIPLKSEFTRDSIRKFASLYFGVKLDLYGSSDVDEDTQYDIIVRFKQTIKYKQETYQKKIKQQILNTINKNALNGTIGTGGDTDTLIQQLHDPYSLHLTGNDNRIFQQMIDGTINGIGISIGKTTESYITIVSVFSGSPAMDAGLLADDHIIRIDDHNITLEDNLQDLTAKIQGTVNTTVTITIQRGTQQFTKTITRKKIVIEPIQIKKLTSDKVLMTISSFQIGMYNLFVKNLPIITTYPTIIIDLRNNGGGSLDDTRLMLNHFITKGKSLYHVVTDSQETSILSEGSTSDTSLQNKKVIFLTNKYSASASEILAGIVREYNPNTRLIGEQSYGKGSIQTVRNYADGSILKLTTAHRLLGKSKTSIQGIGLTPDYAITDDSGTTKDEVVDYIINNI